MTFNGLMIGFFLTVDTRIGTATEVLCSRSTIQCDAAIRVVYTLM